MFLAVVISFFFFFFGSENGNFRIEESWNWRIQDGNEKKRGKKYSDKFRWKIDRKMNNNETLVQRFI